MQELQNKVIKWAEDKGIFANSDPISQFIKTISEVGELADAVNKNDLPAITTLSTPYSRGILSKSMN